MDKADRHLKSVRLLLEAPMERVNHVDPSSSIHAHTSSQCLLPGERVSDDGGEIVILWRPPQHRAGAIASCNDLCWIAWSARYNFDLEVDTADALNHLNHLTHRETMAIAAI